MAGLGDLLDFSQYFLQGLMARHLTELKDKIAGPMKAMVLNPMMLTSASG